MISKTDVDPDARKIMRKQIIRAAIEFGDTDNIVADAGQGLDRIGDRRHARCHRQPGNSALQSRHTLLQHIIGRVHDTGVDIPGDFQIKQIRAMLCVIKGIGGGLIDRNRDGFGGRIRRITGMDRERFKFHVFFLTAQVNIFI